MKKAVVLLFVFPASILFVFELKPSLQKEKHSFDKQDRRYPILLQEQWMGIYFKKKKLGFSYSALFQGKSGFRRTSRAVIQLTASDSLQKTSFNQETFLSKKKEIEAFNFSQEMSGHLQVVEGVYQDGLIKMQIASSGAISKKSVPLPKESVTGSTLDFLILKKGLRAGNRYPVNLFIEPLQTLAKVDISVIGSEKMVFFEKQVEVFKIEMKFNGLRSFTWITKDGKILREVSLEGLESVREPREKALNFDDAPLAVTSFINFSLVRTQENIENQCDLEYIRVEISGLSETALIPQDGRQTVERERKDEKGLSRAILKIHSRYQNDIPENEVRPEYLDPTPEIQSDFPEIVERATQIVGKETDPRKKALLILHWVFSYMDKKPVDTFTAVDALHTKEGECQSHANLFAALTRASGIPTRVASGLVYSKKEKGFLYHAWPEVFTGDWVAMDPTFGQELADPTHIKLATGGWDQQLNLLNFIGKISIEVLDYTRRK